MLIDVKAIIIIIEQSKINHAELKEALPKAKFTKAEKKELIKEIEEAIAIGESIKADINNEKTKRA